MVGIITGKSFGLERSSAFVLGSQGQLGNAALGRDGESVFVNAANGNLVVTRQDEFLIGLGPDVSIGRTYNSQATVDGDNNDNWRASVYRKVQDLSGTYGAAATTVKRIDWDGSDTLYTWNAAESAYVATDGAGAYDKLTRSGDIWTWTDGNSRITELYDQTKNGLITTTTDTDGNSLTYTYNATSGLITRVTSLNGAGTDEYVDLTYSGTNLTQLLTTKSDGTLTRVRYTYDGSNRLSTVTVDLSPNDSAVGDGYKYVTTYTYHGTSTRVASIAQSDGSLLEISYVQDGSVYRVSSYAQTIAAGVVRTTSFDYSAAGRTMITDPAGLKTIFHHDSNGNLTAIAYPSDGTSAARLVQFAYNANGDVVSATHGPGNTITYGYDSRGNMVTERDSAGNLVWRTYGSKNELLTESRTLNWSPSVPASSFESPSVGTSWAYNPTISGATFSGLAGIVGNGSAFGFAATTDGSQMAFLQSAPGYTSGSISQTISGLKAGTRYVVTFSIAARPYYGGSPIAVSFDGNALGTFPPTSTNFETIVVGFVATGTTGTLVLAGTASATDVTTAIDSVKVAEVQTSWYAYDGENHLRYALDGEGGVTQYSYDAPGQLISTLELAGHSYTESGLRPGKPIVDTVLDTWASGLSDKSTARRSDRSYDFRGGLNKVWSHSKLLSTGAFDTASDKSEMTYVYDQAGNLRSRISNASAAAETFVYDGLNRMTIATDSNANVTKTYFMDTLGQTVVTHANGLSETSTYNRGGELISFARSEAGANLVDLSGWPGNPASVPSGEATPAGWLNPWPHTDETQWASTIGPDGVPIVAMRSGQLDASLEGGGNFTNYVTIDASKAYEFTYYFKFSALDKHAIYFGLSSAGPTAYVENAANGTDTDNPYFYAAWHTGQGATYSVDKWYKVVGYVLPQGAAAPGTPLGGVYDVATGQKVADIAATYRWNAERPNDVIYSRFFNYYGEGNQQYSTYFDRPEIRQVSAPAAINPNAETSQYRYDNLGRLRMTIDPTGRRQYMMYDSVGRKIADIDADGSVIEYRYDGNDNLTSTTRYFNKLTGSLVDSNGNPTNAAFSTLRPASHANDSWTFQIYDRAQRLVQTIDGTGATTVYTYDGASQLVSTKSYANKIDATALANLKAAAAASTPNLWDLAANGAPATSYNLTFAAATPIDGASAFLVTVGSATDWQAFRAAGINVQAGQTLTATITLKAVGAVTSDYLGLYGSAAIWGQKGDSTGLVVSGPGTIAQADGGLFYVTGLSTTEATRITISRTYWASEWASPYFYLGDGTMVQGRQTIISAPVYTSESPNPILPTADAANDRTTRNFYDKDGRVIGTLDGAGGLTRFVYDKVGRKVTELGAAKAANSSLWASGTLAELVTSVGTSTSDRRVDYVYDARGFLRFTVDANARPVEMVYDAAGRVIRTVSYAGSIASSSSYSLAYVTAQLTSTGLATNAANRITRTVYDAAGQAIFGIDATGAVNAFAYDSVGNVIKQTAYATLYTTPGDPSLATMQSWATGQASNTSNRISRNVYDLMGRVAYAVDAENYVTEHRYDRAGRALKNIIYAGTYTVADGVTKESLAVQIGAPSGAVAIAYAYDADGLLSETTDGAGSVTRFAYDAQGRLTDTTAAYGTADVSTMRRAYDVLGRVTGETHAYGTAIAATTAFEYDSLGNLTKTTDPLGHKVVRTYDRLGRVLETSVWLDETGATDLKTTNEYDAFGNLGVVTDASGSTFTYYDALGRETLQSDAEEYITQTSYNAFGDVYQVTRRGARGTGTRTLTVKPTVVTGAGDATTTFDYDKNGLVVFVQDAMGFAEYTSRTTFGEGWFIQNKLVGLSGHYYDRLGREYLSFVQAPVYNADGSLVNTVHYPNSLAYDSRGNLVTKVEAAGTGVARITSYVYDGANRLIQIIHPSVEIVGADLVTTSTVAPTESFTYNARGQLIKSVDAGGGTTHLYYDALGRKTWEVNAVGTLSQWTYDLNGNVVSLKVYADPVAIPGSPGGAPPTAPAGYRETLYQYDYAGRLTKTITGTFLTGEYSGSAYATQSTEVATTTAFYKVSRATRETDARGNATWTWYDKLGRQVAQVDRDNYLTVWTRDSNGNALTETRYAGRITGSFSETTIITALQALAGTGAADRATTFTYDLNGQRLTETRLGVVAWTLSSTGALVAASTSATITYTYNALGLVTSKTEANGDRTDYIYDNVGRLVTTKGAAFTDHMGSWIRLQTDFLYDALGNVVRTVQHGDVNAYHPDRISTSTYGAGGRLYATTDAAGFTRHFQYDAAGRVVKEWYDLAKSDNATTVREAAAYRYDAAGRLITQFNATWNSGPNTWTAGDATRIAYNVYGEVSGKGLTGGPDDTAVYQEQFFYDPGGRLWKSTAGDGTVKLIFYDKAGNMSLTLTSTGANLSSYTSATAAATLTAAGSTTIANAVTTILVNDKRGLQVQSREPDRQLALVSSVYTTASFVRNRVYNAFGDVLSESDPRNAGWLTEYAYNAMGRMVEKKSPTISWTSESGAVANARPTETYYYDLSGRMIGARDANNNLTTRKLENGTGHEGGEALVNVEYHADGGKETTWHNVFGDSRVLVDALDQWEVRGYDAMGRVNEVVHRGNLISDYYAYDGLGRRLRHWNSVLGVGGVARTDYDRQGRVSQQIETGGDTTTYAYAWSGTLATTGLGTFGGWTVTTTHANSKTIVEQKDLFGRGLAKTDMGNHAFTYGYDLGGRMTSQTVGATTQTYGWFNTGLSAWFGDGAGNAAAFKYDAAGNRVMEWTQKAYVTVQQATASFDALNRMTVWEELGNGTLTTGSPPAKIDFEYDLAGNIRHKLANYRTLDMNGNAASDPAWREQWYRYDNMNRMVIETGVLVGGQIIEGTVGVGYGYDVAGRRVASTRYHEGTIGFQGEYGWEFETQILKNTESFTYRADGAMTQVYIAQEDFVLGGGPTPGPNQLRASYTYDAMGRLTHQVDWAGNGTLSVYDRTITYNAKGQIYTDTTITKRGNDSFTAATTNQYGSGTDYALGAVTQSVTTNHKTTSTPVLQSTVTATNNYAWWDGAVQSTTGLFTDYPSGMGTDTNYTTTYSYSAMGQLASVYIGDGRPRTVTFVTDMSGQVIRRDEVDGFTSGAASGDPHEIYYRYGGRELGYTGNNGTLDTDYLTSITTRTITPATGNGAFRYNATTMSNHADFDQSLEWVNSYSSAGSGGYTARAGDTLQSVALQLWGDSSLWYKLAEANGIGAGGGLTAGQTLTVPPGILASGYSSETFKPYDPVKALGDLSPTAIKPAKKPGGCGMLGQILLLAIAIGVTILTSGALIGAAATAATAATATTVAVAATTATGLTAALGATGAAIAAGAIGGIAGSIASQAFGLATGIQDKFDWKGVAMAGLTGGITGGVNASGVFGAIQSPFIKGAVSAATSSALTQGIGVATGLQAKFDWAGVASAAVSGGVSDGLEPRLGRMGQFTAKQFSNAAGTLAGAAARSIVTGTSFGDNIIAVLPEVIGSTIGNALANGMYQAIEEAQLRAERRAEIIAQKEASAGASVQNIQSLTVMGAPAVTDLVMPGTRRAPPVGTRMSINEFINMTNDDTKHDIAESATLANDINYFNTNDILGTPGRRLVIEIAQGGKGYYGNGVIYIGRDLLAGSRRYMIRVLSHEFDHAYGRGDAAVQSLKDSLYDPEAAPVADPQGALVRIRSEGEARAYWHQMMVLDEIYDLDELDVEMMVPGRGGRWRSLFNSTDRTNAAAVSAAIEQMVGDIGPLRINRGSTDTYSSTWQTEYEAIRVEINPIIESENTHAEGRRVMDFNSEKVDQPGLTLDQYIRDHPLRRLDPLRPWRR